jgi:hypothetical protein
LAGSSPQLQRGRYRDVGRQEKQQRAAYATGGALGAFRKRLHMAQLDEQAPREHAGRRQLNYAIEAKMRSGVGAQPLTFSL